MGHSTKGRSLACPSAGPISSLTLHHAEAESLTRTGRCRSPAKPLRGVADDHSHNTAGQNDLKVVAVLHVSHKERQCKPDYESEQDSERYRVYLAGEDSCRHPGDQAFDRRTHDNAHHHRTDCRW